MIPKVEFVDLSRLFYYGHIITYIAISHHMCMLIRYSNQTMCVIARPLFDFEVGEQQQKPHTFIDE